MNAGNEFIPLLMSKAIRSDKTRARIATFIFDQDGFDQLFQLVFSHERSLVLRAMEEVEDIVRIKPYFLELHKGQLLSILKSADHKDLKSHLPRLLPMMTMTADEINSAWHTLTFWARNPNENKIARVNALQGLFDLSAASPEYVTDFETTLQMLEHDLSPPVKARARKLQTKQHA